MAKRIVIVKRILATIFILVAAASTTAILSAQTQSQPATADVLKALDQLVEQNRKLEQQNAELMKQINSLRESLATQTAPASQPPPSGAQLGGAQPSQPGTVSAQDLQQQTAAVSSSQDEEDDKTLLPQASNGQPGVFGEFNPGRGFTVAAGKFGKLNLSGYLAARYLNQLPADQAATDHLGRPIAVEPVMTSNSTV